MLDEHFVALSNAIGELYPLQAVSWLEMVLFVALALGMTKVLKDRGKVSIM